MGLYTIFSILLMHIWLCGYGGKSVFYMLYVVTDTKFTAYLITA